MKLPSFTNLERPDRSKAVTEEQDALKFPFQTFGPSRRFGANGADTIYSAEDLAKAVEEARRATALDVETRTRATLADELSQRKVNALEAIRDQLGASEADFRQRVMDAAAMAQSVAKMMGQAIVPKALEKQPLADITEMVRQSLLRLVDQPSIDVRLEIELVDEMTDILKNLVDETGFQGELTATADPALGVGEAKLVWSGGACSRDLGRKREEVDLLVDAWFDHFGPAASEATDAGSADSGLDDDAGARLEDSANAMPEAIGAEPDASGEGVTS